MKHRLVVAVGLLAVVNGLLAWLLLAQETAAAASDDGPFEAIGTALGRLVLAHPAIAGVILAAMLVAVAGVCGLRMAWPVRAERPRWVRFALGVLDLFALNFWDAATWIVGKVGIKLRPLPEDAKSAEMPVPEEKP